MAFFVPHESHDGLKTFYELRMSRQHSSSVLMQKPENLKSIVRNIFNVSSEINAH
jgi:hypothetical protein